jgi:hypothetical protein
MVISLKRLVKKTPSNQYPYHAFYGYPWLWGYGNYYDNAGNYGGDDYGATDSSSDSAGGSYQGYDLSIGGDFGGCEGKRRLIKKED